MLEQFQLVCCLDGEAGRGKGDVTINGCVQACLQKMVQKVKMMATMVQLNQ